MVMVTVGAPAPRRVESDPDRLAGGGGDQHQPVIGPGGLAGGHVDSEPDFARLSHPDHIQSLGKERHRVGGDADPDPA